jgi:putative ATPase
MYELEPLSQLSVLKVVLRGAAALKGRGIKMGKAAASQIARVARGDARRALCILEAAFNYEKVVTPETVKRVAPSKHFALSDQEHFDFASAFQGSIQASDADSAVYWLAKWLESGEDPRYVARRLLVCAHEDAASTPMCAAVAHSAYVTAKEIGRPECDIALSHAAILIATSPRNKSALRAIAAALKDVRDGRDVEVPKSMRDSHYKSCEKLNRGAYADGGNPEAYVGVNRKYYEPEIKDWAS